MRHIERHAIEYNPAYARLPGSDPVVALFLSFLVSESVWASSFGEVEATSDYVWKHTGLSYSQQARSARVLKELGLIEKTLVGLPARVRYRFRYSAIHKACAASLESRVGK